MAEANVDTPVHEIPDHIKAYVADIFNDGTPAKNLHVESGGYGFTKANGQVCLITPERLKSDLGPDAVPTPPKAPTVDGKTLAERYKAAPKPVKAAEPPAKS